MKRFYELPKWRPALMGVLNVTPDSFSDGGLHFDRKAAIRAGQRMAAEGADIIDVGGESTRPGATPVPEEEELARVLPVTEELASHGVVVSIDTRKAAVAARALAAGAAIVNDVMGLRDPAMRQVCAEADCTVCVMHMQGEPQTMQNSPTYGDVVAEVKGFLLDQAAAAEAGGIAKARIWIDPGIGFGKTVNHNLELLRHLDALTDTDYPVLLGASRKSFLSKIAHAERVEDRLAATLAVQSFAQIRGVRILRAHDVREARQGIDALAAITGHPLH